MFPRGRCGSGPLPWRRLPDPGLGSAEGSFGPGAVPAGAETRCRMGGGSVGPGCVLRSGVPVPVRSQPEHRGGGSGRPGSVEAGRREAGHAGAASAQPGGRRPPPVGPGGGRAGMRLDRVPLARTGPVQNSEMTALPIN